MENNNFGPNWLGLLKWSLSYSDGTSPTNFHPMSNENKVWLENVMKELIKDEGQRLCEILKEFQQLIDHGLSSNDGDHIIELLEETQTMIDQIDMANIFVKFGGIKVLKTIILSTEFNEQFKCLPCILIGELSQNNPIVQEQMYVNGMIDDLCVLALSCNLSKLCVKSIYGLSCIIRGHKNSEYRFYNELNGPIFFSRLLQRNDSLCTNKILFLLSALLSSDFITMEMISTYCDLLLVQCYPFLQLKTNDPLCDATLQLLTSLTQTNNGKRYLNRYQMQILGELENKYQMIQVEKRESPDEDYTSALEMIASITDIIKKGVDDLVDSTPTQEQENSSTGSQSQEQPQLRLCG